MTPMQKTLMEGFSQEFIDLESCHDDYKHYGIATVCDGDNLTADEIDESECNHDHQQEIIVCDKCGTVKL
ncbi:hypothetical protein P9621_gp26 [Escherichia phage UAE_MI-01]|uniref:Uncharacterized protein n=1 Tax=Escherichia phage UAE_MI-01 TaxID=2823683 RepID=A0A8E5NPY7_9CAUD|nr:hypothetical protein P9621_gp26 [Escherichia phage UAE_MI-01]QGH77284.1 hypothetical protein [Escherichia phage BEK2-2]QVD49033.1 hypothetical protein UAEMI01_0026 [Escherichia phage UAE_MI-01]